MIVHAAGIQDADGAGDLLRRLKRLYCWLRVVFADSVYDRLPVLLACFLLGLTLVIVRRLAGSAGFVLLPRRWMADNAHRRVSSSVDHGRFMRPRLSPSPTRLAQSWRRQSYMAETHSLAVTKPWGRGGDASAAASFPLLL